MIPKHQHKPIDPGAARVRCPVCREVVYSRAGIHPQCAVKQSEPPRPKPQPKEAADLTGDGGPAADVDVLSGEA